MSNISEQYRKPLMSDDTGKAIADKLGGESVTTENISLAEQYRKPLMSEETAREILEKIAGGSEIQEKLDGIIDRSIEEISSNV